ncbi:MAG: cation transporter, partial [Anaerolineales bacterium]|nr:cation transporter [Anaerolineales bacterium]
MTLDQTIEVPILGMDCAECTQHVQHAIAALPGVRAVDVLLAAEKAVVRLDPVRVDREAIARAVEGAGYHVSPDRQADARGLRRSISRLLIII